MISNDGIVKLIDFNAAKEFDQSQIEDTRLMGTRKFAAPEQYGFGQSDPRTDLYALGVTMYYLLTKDYPDSGLSGTGHPEMHCLGPFRALSGCCRSACRTFEIH